MSDGTRQPTRSFIIGMGHYHPPNELDNEFFNELGIGSDPSWIEERTGIRSRRSVMERDNIIRLRDGTATLEQLRDEGLVPTIADISEPAWKHLQSRFKEENKGVEALICGTSVPDFDIPANACSIAARIGLTVPAIDTNSACSSFVVDMHIARGLLTAGFYHKIAIFNPERYSLRMNYTDRSSCILFGDGCSAALVSDQEQSGALEIIDTLIESDPEGYDLVKVPDGKPFSQNGKAVQKFAISRTIETTRAILDRNQLKPEEIQYFTGHQANLRMVMSAAERLGLSTEKHLFNVDRFGNQGAAGAPAVLSMNWDLFKPGDHIVLAVVGSGLTWGSMLLRKV